MSSVSARYAPQSGGVAPTLSGRYAGSSGVAPTLSGRYKIPLLVSLVMALAIIALKPETFWLNAVFTFAGAILAIVAIDLDYIIFAYFLDPADPRSVEIRILIRNRQYRSYVAYLNQREYEFNDLAIRSILFQFALILFTFFALAGREWAFVQGFSLAFLANMLYSQFTEFQKTYTLKRWFWIYNGQLSHTAYIGYLLVMALILVLLITGL